jgi:hypothetical protein
MAINRVHVLLQSDLSKTKVLNIEVSELAPTERLLWAAKKAASFLVLAFFALFIPAAHLILVPLFVLVAAYTLYSVYHRHFGISGGEVICPACDTVFDTPKGTFSWPMRVSCPHCLGQLKIEPDGETWQDIH